MDKKGSVKYLGKNPDSVCLFLIVYGAEQLVYYGGCVFTLKELQRRLPFVECNYWDSRLLVCRCEMAQRLISLVKEV